MVPRLTWIKASGRLSAEDAPSARGEPLKMEVGNMMVATVVTVVMGVFLVTLMTVTWLTEGRKR
jgi:hypothetical protein